MLAVLPKPPNRSTSLTIDKAFSMCKTNPPPKTIHPSHKPHVAKTHRYARYCTSTNPILADFKTYLATPDEGSKHETEAKQIPEDVSKYLYLASSQTIDQTTITDQGKLNDYAKKLLDEGVGIQGVMTKLDRLSLFTDYRTLSGGLQLDKTEHIKKKWKQELRNY